MGKGYGARHWPKLRGSVGRLEQARPIMGGKVDADLGLQDGNLTISIRPSAQEVLERDLTRRLWMRISTLRT